MATRFDLELDFIGQRGNKGDMAQLLYYLDSGHFAEFLERYKSDSFEENARIFASGGPEATPMQWDVRQLKRKKEAVVA